MPIYEYYCPNCGHQLEVLQSLNEAAPACPECHHDTMIKKVSAAGFQLKGGGWYATDYKKSSAPTAPETKTEETKKESPPADKPAEKKASDD